MRKLKTTIFILIFLLFSSPAFAKVLIIQDISPWGISAIQTILANNTISYDQITSSQLGTADLSIYTMIIVPSVQGNTYYANWNTYLYKVKEFVHNGGKLWMSTCNSAVDTEPLLPGGVISSSDPDSYNTITAPGHPWISGVPDPISGSNASHDSYSSLYPGSTVIAKAQTSGLPVLVDYRYGAGRILITGQTLEYAWNYNWDAKPILENSLLDLHNSRDDVLIIQDQVPWSTWIAGGAPSIQDVLTLNYIPYDQLPSNELAATDLSQYTMIIMPSLQGTTYYENWNANIGKIESYVRNGGKLWQSTCNESSTVTEPMIPGGVTSSNDIDFYNTISSPLHPWVKGILNPIFGNGASHDSFTSLYPGSTIVAKAKGSGRPVLVDYHYGDGRVFITGQTLELAWMYGWDSGPILENSLLELRNSVDDVLLIKDQNPWSSTAIQDTLSANFISYDQIASSLIGTIDLSRYKMIVVPSVQGNSYYLNWNANIAKIEKYVRNGGKLWQSACNQSLSTEPLIPGGVTSSSDPEKYNDILLSDHPWVKGVPNPMYGNSANHDSFTNLYPGSRVIAATQISGKPVLVEYVFGAGRIMLTGQTLEYAWENNLDGKPILENSLVDLFTPKPFPWNLFLPAILMNKAKR